MQQATNHSQIISTLAEELILHYVKSFEVKKLKRMMQFAEAFADFEIVVPLARQLSWFLCYDSAHFAKQGDKL